MNSDPHKELKQQVKDLKLYETVIVSGYSELQRVPGGYVHLTWNPDNNNSSFASCFIPISEVIKDTMIYED